LFARGHEARELLFAQFVEPPQHRFVGDAKGLEHASAQL
jgi:hypothetical protein